MIKLFRAALLASLALGAPAEAKLVPSGFNRLSDLLRFVPAATGPAKTFATAQNYFPKTNVTVSGAETRAEYWQHVIPAAATDVIPTYDNWINIGNSGTTPGATLTIVDAALLCPNGTTVVPVTKGGAASWTLADGAADVEADPIPATACGYSNGQFPAGATFWFADRKSSSTGTFATVAAYSGDVAGQQVLVYAAASTTTSTSAAALAAGGFTTSGTAPTTRTADGTRPVFLGHLAGATPHVYVALGDSITEGATEQNGAGVASPASGPYGRGWFQRALRQLQAPGANFAVFGTPTTLGSTNPSIQAMLGYGNRGLIFYGTNDIGTSGGAGSADAPTIESRLQQRLAQVRASGIQIVGGVKLLARTDSTNFYTTESGQTPSTSPFTGWAAGGVADQVNSALSGLGFSYVIPMASVRGSTDRVWPAHAVFSASNPYWTGDGTHPKGIGYEAMAQEAAPYMSGDAAPAGPSLGTLTISPTTGTAAAAYSGTIGGKSTGSTLSAPGACSDSSQPSVSGTTFTDTFTGTGNITCPVVETLAGAVNSPRTTSLAFTVAAPPTLGALTLSPTTATTGAAYSGTISGATASSTVSATSSDGTSLTVGGSGASRTLSGTFGTAGSPTITMVETLAGATGSPKSSTATVSVITPVTGATWDSTFNTYVTYSANNKTVTNPSATGSRSMRSNTTRTSGKTYFEVAIAGAAPAAVGFSDVTANATGGGTSGTNRFGWFGATAYYSGGNQSMGGALAVGDVIQIAVDLDTHLYWIRRNGTGNWNNTAGADPVGETGGLALPAELSTIYAYGNFSATSGEALTLHAAAGEDSYAAPSGYGAWPNAQGN